MGSDSGFTLYELLFTMVIAAVLAAVAVPSFMNLLERHTANAVEAKLFRSYQAARNLAVTSADTVSVCGSDDGATCRRDWRRMLLTFVDENNDGVPDTDEVYGQVHFDLNANFVRTRLATGSMVLRLDARGRAVLTGSFVYCTDEPHLARRVTWNRTGRSYRGIDKNGDGRVEDTSAATISC